MRYIKGSTFIHLLSSNMIIERLLKRRAAKKLEFNWLIMHWR